MDVTLLNFCMWLSFELGRPIAWVMSFVACVIPMPGCAFFAFTRWVGLPASSDRCYQSDAWPQECQFLLEAPPPEGFAIPPVRERAREREPKLPSPLGEWIALVISATAFAFLMWLPLLDWLLRKVKRA